METVCRGCNHMISPPDSDANFCAPPLPPPSIPPQGIAETSENTSIKTNTPAEIKWHGGWKAYVVKFDDFETEAKLVVWKSNFPSIEQTLQIPMEYHKAIDDIRAETYAWSKQDLLLQCKKNGLASTGTKDAAFERFMRKRAEEAGFHARCGTLCGWIRRWQWTKSATQRCPRLRSSSCKGTHTNNNKQNMSLF